MANDKTATSPELDELAFRIYTESVARTSGRRGGDKLAMDSFRKAESFLAVRDKVRSGELKTSSSDGPQLADCCAPNLPRNHPHNMVAAHYTDRKSGQSIPGDLAKVSRVAKWLAVNPTPESDPDELVQRLRSQFPELTWDLPTINVARAVFPAYAIN